MLYLNSLAHLMRTYEHRCDFEKSLACGQRILEEDPLREEIHRAMMRLYLQNGQRALAVRQYQICRDALGDELGISPMEETQALYNQMIPVSDESRTQFKPAPDIMRYQSALKHLRLATRGFDEAQEHLKRAIRLFERST
jgi:DNA-binding SARP family transcriptional activator